MTCYYCDTTTDVIHCYHCQARVAEIIRRRARLDAKARVEASKGLWAERDRQLGLTWYPEQPWQEPPDRPMDLE